ncbi:dGTPase [Sagittula marina]|uniref:dGTPase n=1 Tax=Sagittula marina TaxID=943940 RepID=A0A7W6GTQ2_9RHOB|nr:dNTP triphosphohydrolase [Sagittula marina]MBB3987766.1 dGTPase [Sagittula marina]
MTTNMTWDALLNAQRLGDDDYIPRRSRSIFLQDHDRIVFSAPFRRLANKTQVQPLYAHDHVHHRLIHSIEVGSVGRSLAMRVSDWLEETGHVTGAQAQDLPDIVQAACVAHDIGNPPFGHSGEESMGAWFAEAFAKERGLCADLPKELRHQFTAFEGNAQGFRILTRLEMYRNDGGMRLSKAVLGAFTKYPVTAADRKALLGSKNYVGLKKFGIFNNELAIFSNVAEGLGLSQIGADSASAWARHPLVFLVEAADDITYNIVDLEDAFTTGELPFQTVRDLLADVIGAHVQQRADMTEEEQIAYLRARAIGAAIDACATAFQNNYADIMSGRFSDDLVGASRLSEVFAGIKRTARERIFTATRKTELEISGRRIIANVMSGILPVYEDLASSNWNTEHLSEHSTHLVRALKLDLRDVTDPESALHALADFTSGMTDRYALRMSRMLSGT